MTHSPSSQDLSSIASEHSPIIPEEDPNAQQILLNKVQTPAEILQQIDAQFDSKYCCYNWWLLLMIIISGLYLCEIVIFISFWSLNSAIRTFFVKLLIVALHSAFFAQFVLAKWALSTRDLITADSAVKVITFFSGIFLALNVWTGYNLCFYPIEHTDGSEEEASEKAALFQFFIIASIFSVIQIFITHLQAIKVRNDLIKREAIRANLQDPIALLPISALSSI